MKPTTDQVLPLVRAYYAKNGNSCGGNMHIVLDDGNTDLDSILFCRNQAQQSGDADGERIANLLIQMSLTQRNKIYHSL